MVKDKICTKCGESKPVTSEYFSRDRRLKSGLCAQCKICRLTVSTKYFKTKKGHEVRKKANAKRQPSKERKLYEHKRGLRRNYNMTLEQYDEMFEEQNGVCKICGGINENGRRLYVDHNHETGKIRGLLCGSCNSAIGYAKENPLILRLMINYLGDK